MCLNVFISQLKTKPGISINSFYVKYIPTGGQSHRQFVDRSREEMVILITVFLDSVWPVLEDVWRDASCCLPLIRWRVRRRTRRQRLFDRGGRKRQVLRGAYRELGPKCQDCRCFHGYWRRGGMGNIERSDVLSQLDATVFTTAVQATRTVSTL